MKESGNVIQEEFLLLAERLKLDTQSLPVKIIGTPEYFPPTFIERKAGQRTLKLCVGPDIANWKHDETPTRRLSVSELESVVGVYKKLFLPHRQVRFIGADLDDSLYDVTPIRNMLVQKIISAVERAAGLESETAAHDSGLLTPELQWALYSAYKDDIGPENVKMQMASAILASHGFSGNCDEIVKRSYNAYKDFSRLDAPEIRVLYKPYDGVKDTLKHLMSSGDFVVGILTNGPSKFQKDKINLLGLKEGEHFNFVMVSQDVGIGKPSSEFFEFVRERASQYTNRPLKDEECLILEDQVRNLSGADGWLKVQYLKGYHSTLQPENIREIPKYGIMGFADLTNLLILEKDSGFQSMAACYFVLKLLLLLRQGP